MINSREGTTLNVTLIGPKSELFSHSVKSTDFRNFKVASQSHIRTVDVGVLECKMILVPHNNEFVAIKLLHLRYNWVLLVQ